MKDNTLFLIVVVLLFLYIVPSALAEEGDDIEVFGLELEKLLNLGSALLAVALLFITSIAYKRTKRSRLKYVCAAFLLFAIKGFLMSAELFFGDWSLVDPITSVLDFAIIIAFFIGMVKR
mgnify:CR=1 FL=1